MWEENNAFGDLFTFKEAKDLPIYNWFYYKEAFSPQLLDLFKVRGNILDPFSGSGTTTLWAKLNGFSALGIDAFPLAVFVGQTKIKDYTEEMLSYAEALIPKIGTEEVGTPWKWEAIISPNKAIPKRNINFFLRARAQLAQHWFEGAQLLLLALISSIPQCSLVIKDGGVLKIDMHKRVLPAKEIFRRKAKKIISEIRACKASGSASVVEGDARLLDFQEVFDWVFTSPPYLNAIDYQKVYSLEAGLLGLEPSTKIRSYIKTNNSDVVLDYLSDMEMAINGIEISLKRGGKCGIIVGNTVIAGSIIEIDKLFVEIAESKGLNLTKAYYKERVAQVGRERKKVRETLLLFEKN